MKRLLSVIALTVVLLALLVFSACDKSVKFNVEFIVDGEVYSTVATGGGKTIELPQEPTKEGYSFVGWYKDNGIWQKPFKAESLVGATLSSDMKVYARWEERSEDVGSSDGSEQKISSDKLTVNGNEISGTISHSAEVFNFAEDITVSPDAVWVVSTDAFGMQAVATKTVPLELGENVFYIHVTDADQSVSS